MPGYNKTLLAIAIVGLAALIIATATAPVMTQPVKMAGATNLGPNVNSSGKEYAPVISADGNTLYFTSDRPGGRGETDFWYSKRVGSGWGPATNLGAPINTALPEGTCTITPSQTMVIFAICDDPGSQKKKGLGSCDLYWSHLSGDQWSTPVNMGEPVNTKFWDSRPSIAADGRTLYFVSERPYGLDREYWQYLDGDYPSKWPDSYKVFYGDHDIYVTVLDDRTSKWSEPRRLGEAVNTMGADTSPFIHADGVSLYFSSNGRQPNRGGLDIYKATLKGGVFTDTISLSTYDPGYTINTTNHDYFFTIPASGDVGYLSADARPGSMGGFDIYVVPLPYALRPKRITTLLGVVYNVKSIGKPDARVTVKHRDKITGTIKDVKAKPIGRPAEIKLVDFLSGEVVKKDQSNPRTGKYTAIIDPGRKYTLTVKAKCYFPFETNYEISEEQSGETLRLDVPLKPMVPGEGVVLPNIYFDFAKATLKPESFPALNRVRDLMNEYPTISVELGGHTDCVGSDSYNQRLSQARAESCKQYLIQQGISPDRITAVGYGETQPVDASANNPCHESQVNRRTEFKILRGLECE